MTTNRSAQNTCDDYVNHISTVTKDDTLESGRNHKQNFTDQLYYHLIKDRTKLGSFLSEHIEELEYDTLCQAMIKICKDHPDVTINRLMNGTLGASHNARMSFSVFPTWNLYRVITKIMNRFAISKLVDIGTGIGLIPYVFNQFNKQTRRVCIRQKSVSLSDTVPLKTIIGVDPLYQLSTAIPINGAHIEKLDFFQYITDEKQQFYDESAAYMFVDPIFILDNSGDNDSGDVVNHITKFFANRKPKLVMILGDLPKAVETQLMYKCIKTFPKTMCLNDTLYNISSVTPTTHFKLYVFVRDDIQVPELEYVVLHNRSKLEIGNLEVSSSSAKLFPMTESVISGSGLMFDSNSELDTDAFRSDLLSEIRDRNIDTLNMFVDTDCAPVCCRDITDERRAAEITGYIVRLGIKLPMHLKTVGEVESYIAFHGCAITLTGMIPDILEKRENFIFLQKYFCRDANEVLDELREHGYVPNHLSEEDVFIFLLKDYSYSDKVNTGISDEYVKLDVDHDCYLLHQENKN